MGLLQSIFGILLLASVSAANAGTSWYVSPTGDDAGAGSLAQPFATIQRAQQSAVPGDTVFIRGGTYRMEESKIAGRKGIFGRLIVLDKSGEPGKPITYRAYQDERPVFECSAVKPRGQRVTAFFVSGSWLRLEGLEVVGVQVTIKTHTQSICFESNGSHNVFERLAMHDGQAIGIYHVRGSDNLFLNCDAWNNWDCTSEDGKGGNVDGFGCHPTKGGTGNVFRGCRAWFNSDDGYDLIGAREAVTLEHCWAMYNGFSPKFERLADGNGFKAGGYGSTAASDLPNPIPRHTIRFCLAVGNKNSGFYANHHPGGSDWFNNSAYRNGANFNMLGRLSDNRTDVDGYGHKLRNNLSYKSRRDIAKFDAAKCDAANNSFDLGLKLTDRDFVSLDERELTQPRRRDGSLPATTLLKPADGSPLHGWHTMQVGLLLALALVSSSFKLAGGADVAAPASAVPYQDNADVVAKIAALGSRSSLALPPFKVDAKSSIYGCQQVGPVTRGYTMRMVYAPERQTALYHGGDHQTLRSNDVWEYHLGSNTWHMIFEPDGGNQGPYKGVLLFLARKLRDNPSYRLTPEERKLDEEVRSWWKANVVLKDGYLVTTHGGPILPCHTWDTLVYEPKARLMIHGTGAYPCDTAVLHSRYHNIPLAEVDKQLDKSYTSIWMFDPARRQWIIHRRPEKSAMPELRGMGATMCYTADSGRVIYYVAAQNVSPHSYQMWSWDVTNNVWTELKPNGGKPLSQLVLQDKVAPAEELETAYSPKHKKMVAVIGRDTFAYDAVKNEWSRLNGAIPIEAHDAKTTFAYDSRNDVFLLTDGNREGTVAVFSLTENKWELVRPKGDGCPTSDWGGGPYWGQPKGYYDPTHNVLVVHGGFTNRVWLYRHK